MLNPDIDVTKHIQPYYDKFLESRGYPAWSADELVAHLYDLREAEDREEHRAYYDEDIRWLNTFIEIWHSAEEIENWIYNNFYRKAFFDKR